MMTVVRARLRRPSRVKTTLRFLRRNSSRTSQHCAHDWGIWRGITPSITPMIRRPRMVPHEPTVLRIGTFPLIARDEAHKVFGNASVQVRTGREGWQGNEGGRGLLPARPRMIRTEIAGRRPHEPDTHTHK